MVDALQWWYYCTYMCIVVVVYSEQLEVQLDVHINMKGCMSSKHCAEMMDYGLLLNMQLYIQPPPPLLTRSGPAQVPLE